MIHLRVNLVYMIVVSFVIQYYLMSYIMTNNTANIKNSLGKFYLSSVMASMMGLTEMFIMGDQNMLVLCILLIMLVGSVIMYRRQMYINEKEYLNEMIEHHSMAVFTSQEILKKTDNYDVAKLAKNIISKQNDELRIMEELLVNKKL